MLRVWLWLAIVLTIGANACSSSQEDAENLEVSGEEMDAAVGNVGNQDLNLGQEGMGNNAAFNEQGGENSSVAADNPLLNNEGAGEVGAMGSEDAALADGRGVVRYTIGHTNVYAQPDTSSATVRTLPQGEVLLVSISGEFAQSSLGFIAVSDLSAELQPRAFSGNDWQ